MLTDKSDALVDIQSKEKDVYYWADSSRKRYFLSNTVPALDLKLLSIINREILRHKPLLIFYQ